MKSLGNISACAPAGRFVARGFSLIELAVTLGVGSIVLVVISLLSFYGLQSFLVMGNCAALDDKSRIAADLITRDLRQATQVLRYDIQTDSKVLILTNSIQGFAVGYTWNAETRTVTCEKTDQPPSVYLKDCDAWEAAFFQNIPQPSIAHPYLPATNQFGIADLNLARIVSLSWKCSRPVTSGRIKTEGAQTIQIALRNAAHP